MSAHPDAPEPSHVHLNAITGQLRCLNCGRYIVLALWEGALGASIKRQKAFEKEHKGCKPNTLYEG